MSTPARWEYFRILRIRYQETTSKEHRTRLVDEAVINTGLHRKSVIRALRRLTRLEELDGRQAALRRVPLMNEIYRVQGLISNFFIPKSQAQVEGSGRFED